jgi:hypothetical protein
MNKRTLSKLISFGALVLLFTVAMIVLNQSDLEHIKDMSDAEQLLYLTADMDTGFSINLIISLIFLGFIFSAYEFISHFVFKVLK